jgi:uncharacterized protein YuzE
MEKKIIDQVQSSLPNIMALSKSNKYWSFDYDQEADVLYVSFHKPQQATDSEMINDDILIRKRGDEVVGLTVMNASRFAG